MSTQENQQMSSKHQNNEVQANSAMGVQNQPQFNLKNSQDQLSKTQDLKGFQKRKIIKKFPFNSNTNKGTKQNINTRQVKEQDELKNWKPTNIVVKDRSQKYQQANKKSQQIATQFLSFLPKPVSKNQRQNNSELLQLGKPEIDSLIRKSKKPISLKQSQQQLKWDAEDEFLKKKTSIRAPLQNQHIQAQQKPIKSKILQEQDDQSEFVQKIEWLHNSNTKKQRNLAELIEKNWQKQGINKNKHTMQ